MNFIKNMKMKTAGTVMALALAAAAVCIVAISLYVVAGVERIGGNWKRFDREVLPKAALLEEIRGALGYDGEAGHFSHDLADAANGHLDRVAQQIAKASAAVDAYQALGAEPREVSALADIRAAIAGYRATLDEVARLLRAGVPAHEISSREAAGDGKGRAAVRTLSERLAAAREAAADDVYQSVESMSGLSAGCPRSRLPACWRS